MANLILVRHGKSMWNELNLFTGWVDVPLTEGGVQEALKAGKIISDLPVDIIYTSTLIRAQMTAMLMMTHHQSQKVPIIQHQDKGKLEEWGKYNGDQTQSIPVYCCWQLNERMYGDLQGLNKEETIAKYGKDQVHLWRRSYDVPPPHGESLKDTAARCLPFFQKEIVERLKKGENILISAHGNSLRSIIMSIEKLTPEEVLSLELPTGGPIVYEYQAGKYLKKT